MPSSNYNLAVTCSKQRIKTPICFHNPSLHILELVLYSSA